MSWIKGYGAEWIRRLIWEDIKADSLIPVRKRERRRTRGKYRRELARSFDTKKYHRRNIAETAFSLLKRTLGENLKARKCRYQAKEIKIRLIIYNIRRTITPVRSLLVIELFYKAHITHFLVE